MSGQAFFNKRRHSPGIVHRIDKNTSGLLIVAKTDSAHNFLAAQIKEHSFTREYEAVLTGGRLKTPTGTVDAPIGRSKYDRKKMCVTEQNSKHAVTHYEVLEELGQYSLVKFRLETGRTHQIRVHSAYIGHPVYGDDVYGKAVKGIEGQCLHAKKIGFIHPATKEYMEFDSDLPDYFQAVLKNSEQGIDPRKYFMFEDISKVLLITDMDGTFLPASKIPTRKLLRRCQAF
mgnify:CR=1 FL=1